MAIEVLKRIFAGMCLSVTTGGGTVRVRKTKWGSVELALLADLLYGPGSVLNGAKLDDAELVRASHEAFEGRPFCVVRHWMLMDVMLPVAQEREVIRQGLEPCILYAQAIVYDSQGELKSGDSLLSDYQRDFDGCIFETQDVLYILAGRGSRKHASLPAMDALKAYSKQG
jgi:hypothetical protein